ncbi:MAG: hypothetical protein LBN43_08085 [Oscillospiraceae bacterium]|nr:hypothetical protein [Oscillospiraceae bacterium]
MSLERYLTALCAINRQNPFNHNYTTLMDTAERFAKFPKEVSERIRSLDEIFGICSLDDYHHGEPSAGDAERVIALCHAASAAMRLRVP